MSRVALPSDRRSGRRYPIAADLEYRLMCGPAVIQTGAGRTVDLSARGILFECPEGLAVGTEIEVSVAWPALLNDTVALQLCASGHVARSSGARHAVRILRHEFYLRGQFGLSNRRTNLWPVSVTRGTVPKIAAAGAAS